MRKKQTTNRPTHRVSFARIVGKDENGADIVGSAREIGSVWPRKSGGGGILRLDHIPVELTRHEDVLFINTVQSDTSDQRDLA